MSDLPAPWGLLVWAGTVLLGIWKAGRWTGRIEEKLDGHAEDIGDIKQAIGLPRRTLGRLGEGKGGQGTLG